MKRVDDRQFQATLSLCETGHFEAKCFFLTDGELEPVWPDGENVAVNVSAADTCCANIIYNAFVRQFGPNKAGPVRRSGPGSRIFRHSTRPGTRLSRRPGPSGI